MGPAEAADYLGVTRVRVNQMIDEGKFPSAKRVGSTYAIPRPAVEEAALRSVVIGWEPSLEISAEHVREILDPMYLALALCGVMPAYRAHQAVENGESTPGSLSDEWREASAAALASRHSSESDPGVLSPFSTAWCAR